jgi:N-acyl amino acid synthase of PEP-CTERM/exosortase system
MLDQFCDQFHLVLATTPELREEVYRLRYQVYCQELQYESAAKFPNQQEVDIYDRRSIHCLLQHRESQTYAGCVRVILAQPPESVLFPFEKACSRRLYKNEIDLDKFPRHLGGEVSRLAVREEFRKRISTDKVSVHAKLDHHAGGKQNNCFALIAISLYLAATAIVIEGGLDRAFTMMEPRLARHLRRFGIYFRQIGEIIDYHGKRGPFTLTPPDLLQTLDPRFCDLLAQICSELKAPLSNHLPRVLASTALMPTCDQIAA